MSGHLPSWVPARDDGMGFGLSHLPYGILATPESPPRPHVRVGAFALSLERLAQLELLGNEARSLFACPDLTRFIAAGPTVWKATRERLQELLSTESPGTRRLADELLPVSRATECLPVSVPDFVDFYSSRQHAENLGRLFRPDSAPLYPNWAHLPIGYHGRAGTVRVTGTPIRRPWGQVAPDGGSTPPFRPARQLDYEVELGFIVGGAGALRPPITIEQATRHVFGVVILNDWTARDVQAWEYRPLGPFLGKSFATSISAWVTPSAALDVLRTSGPEQGSVSPYLRQSGSRALDLRLTVSLQSERMRAGGEPPTVISTVSSSGIHWSAEQQLVHTCVNGASLRDGDLHGTGCISDDAGAAVGSLIERSWGGTRPVPLPDGSSRCFLHDGDRVQIIAEGTGAAREVIRLGEVSGTIGAAMAAAG